LEVRAHKASTGQIVGSYSRTTVDPLSFSNHGFLYNRQDGTYTTIDDGLGLPGFGSGTFTQGINDVGQVVGYYIGIDNPTNPTFPSGAYGFLYSGGTFTTLNDGDGQHLSVGFVKSRVPEVLDKIRRRGRTHRARRLECGASARQVHLALFMDGKLNAGAFEHMSSARRWRRHALT
jgi:hypothetical protein